MKRSLGALSGARLSGRDVTEKEVTDAEEHGALAEDAEEHPANDFALALSNFRAQFLLHELEVLLHELEVLLHELKVLSHGPHLVLELVLHHQQVLTRSQAAVARRHFEFYRLRDGARLPGWQVSFLEDFKRRGLHRHHGASRAVSASSVGSMHKEWSVASRGKRPVRNESRAGICRTSSPICILVP